MNIFRKTRIQARELFEDAYLYLTTTYKQAQEVFTPASPFGQILTVQANLSEMIFFYLEAVATELNIARARNIESIYGLSRLTGHNPTRGISAIGSIKIRLNTEARQLITGNYVQIDNYTKVKIKNNSLDYFLKFDSDYIRLDLDQRNIIKLEIIQGEIEEQTFRGTGYPLQSFSVITGEPTDNFMVEIWVNGVQWEKDEYFYDMNKGDQKFITKTGINGGLDVYFGNLQYGSIPPLGSIIKVRYVKTRGSVGNIDGKNLLLTFAEEGKDQFNSPVDLNQILNIGVTRGPSFGSDTENPDFTRIIAPHASKSFVLARPENYIYYLSKYNFFSFIDAYNTKDDEYIDDDNIIYLFLIPDIAKKLMAGQDYFNVPTEEFILNADEQDMVKEIINKSGQQLVTTEMRFVTPTIKRYSLNVVIKWFENYDKNEIRTEVRKALSDYFLSIRRRDSIPRSDIIAILEGINGIDSVNIFFISEENEEAIRRGYYIVPVYGYDPDRRQKVLIENKKITLEENQDPGLGLDGFGDIEIDQNDIVVIRGGWQDRNGNNFDPLPDVDKLSGLNIFFKDESSNDLYAKIQQNRFNSLRRQRGTTIANGPVQGNTITGNQTGDGLLGNTTESRIR